MSDERKVVEELLAEMGVDSEKMRELVESGQLPADILKVESADQVRRRLEIERSSERLREALKQLQDKLDDLDTVVDRVERDVVPVILSFLVGLKGNLVSLRSTIIGRSKRLAKTNLQATFVDTEVKRVVEEEFASIEETLTTGMSAPILDKVRELTDVLKESMKALAALLTEVNARVDDYAQRTRTEFDFLTRELSSKPRTELTPEVRETIAALERRVEELESDLTAARQAIENRDSEIERLRAEVSVLREKNEALEDTVATLRAAPTADVAQLAELRQTIKTVETSRDLLARKFEQERKRAEEAEEKARGLSAVIAEKDIEIGDLQTRVKRLEEELETMRARLAEVDDLRARLRSYESGDRARELELAKAELDRVQGSLERLTADHQEVVRRLRAAEEKISAYHRLMQAAEKTKAYLMVEDNKSMTIREIARALGVSPATVTKWAEDFERLGIARVVDGTTLVPMGPSEGDDSTSTGD